MNDILQVLKEIGSTSLNVFWFPVGLWTVLGLVFLAVMKYSDRIHTIYQYHIRMALLIALPIGIISSYTAGQLLNMLSANSTIPVKFIVLENPITVSADSAQIAAWTDSTVWFGLLTSIAVLGALGYLIKIGYEFSTLRRFSRSLTKISPFGMEECITASNLELAKTVRTCPHLAFSDRARVPFTFGYFRIVVVIPRGMKHDYSKLNMALRHELMHIKHHDYLLNNLFVLIKAAFWFHPLVHFLHSGINEYREISCDSEVLSDASISKRSYAELLFELASQAGFHQNTSTVSMAVNPSTLKKRIQTMKNQTYSSKKVRNSFAISLLTAVCITGVIACSDIQSSGITNEELAEVQNSMHTRSSDMQPLYVINGERMSATEHGNVISRIKSKYIQSIEVLKGATATEEYGEAGKNGVIEIQVLDKELALSDLLSAPPSIEQKQANKEDYFVVVEKMPELIGGLASIQQKVEYPQEAREAGIEGRVIVQFIVNEEGRVENPKVVSGIGGGADEVALEAVRQARFKPGMQRGVPVRVQYAMPIVFRMSDPTLSSSTEKAADTQASQQFIKESN